MTKEEIRMECYSEAFKAVRSKPGIRLKAEDIAPQFAEFCADNPIRLAALQMAVERSNPRIPLPGLLEFAQSFVEFAENKPVIAPQPARTSGPSRSKKKASRRSF